MPRFSLFLLAALLAVGCNGSGCGTPTATTQSGTGKNPPSAPDHRAGHALPSPAEGSEVYPVAWLPAMTNLPMVKPPTTAACTAFDSDCVTTPLRLAHRSHGGLQPDFRLPEEMTGANRAGCHVNVELQQDGKVVMRIDGLEPLLTPALFYGDLVKATVATIESPNKLWAFLRRLGQVNQPAGAPLTLAALPKHTKSALDSYPNFDDLKKGGPLEKDLAARIEALHKEQMAKPPADLRKDLKTTAKSETLAEHAKVLNTPGAARKLTVTPELRSAANKLREETPCPRLTWVQRPTSLPRSPTPAVRMPSWMFPRARQPSAIC